MKNYAILVLAVSAAAPRSAPSAIFFTIVGILYLRTSCSALTAIGVTVTIVANIWQIDNLIVSSINVKLVVICSRSN